ncbi:hypothetical protein JW707_02915 [Candidatus Woesearchaeota archaeon]|nr:hypothetical protein [Candidatus Woesearchaeota archaeon]
MADILKEIHKEIRHASGWVGTEHKLLEGIKVNASRLRSNPSKFKEYCRKMLQNANYLGRSEYYSKRDELKIEENLRKLAGEVPEDKKEDITKALKDIGIAEETLVKKSSRYTGDIRELVKKAELYAQMLVQGEGRQAYLDKLLENLIANVNDAMRWTGGVLAALVRADKIIAELQAMLVG